ncbi:hypothetical protein FSP39_022372 [Pinctada imbricata]|uniref:Acyl-coenzyme A oxidase n=1 Tax=Pinctada imbricata TaxID=66713 RepID=A0AA88YFH7_PINIB|nr:hypothetical protein FSP39_022372 [Pinctada imbricata]
MSYLEFGAIPLQVNPDLQEERDQASFHVTELTHIIDGGAEKTQLRKRLEKLIYSDPDFRRFPDVRTFGTKSEFYGASVLKSIKLFQLRKEHQWTDEESDIVHSLVDHGHALGLHHAMFIPALERLATDEQKAKWLTIAKQYKILGTYAQTELGHGTYLQGLETTATYDPGTQEFILNTPTISAMKWWPGSLGKSSNYAIVLATLITRGKRHGMHPFVVQLRSLEDHQPLPGIKVGEIGAKMGTLSTDNGYLILNNIRILRENMLMKNAQVSPDGTFTASAPNQANYATMVLLRVRISEFAYTNISKAVTIGIRYSAVRRQSKLDPEEKEAKILEYQTQQYKLFPGLALAYAILFSTKLLKKKYREAQTEIMKGNLQSLPELHCETSGSKAFCTEHMLKEVEIIRQSCGGHGYLAASGIGMMTSSSAPLVTVEGENTVMYLQVARYLLKRFSNAKSGEQIEGCTSYLSMNHAPYLCPFLSEKDCRNLSSLCDVYRYRAFIVISRVVRTVQTDIKDGLPQHDAFNKNLVHLVRAARAHCYFNVVKDFAEAVKELDASIQICTVLISLCCFFAVHGIVENSGDFLQTQTIGVEQLKWLKNLQTSLLAEIRPNAVALVDAFDYHDITLTSALGSYDGNAYERLYQSTEKDSMNSQEVHSSYHTYLKPFIQEMNKAKL